MKKKRVRAQVGDGWWTRQVWLAAGRVGVWVVFVFVDFLVEQVQGEVGWTLLSFVEVSWEVVSVEPFVLVNGGDVDFGVVFWSAFDLFHVVAEEGGMADGAVSFVFVLVVIV